MDFTRNEYRIISKMYENGCFTKLCSFKIQRIVSETNLSVPKVRQSMKMFISLGLVQKGAKDERADTFYLTEEGIKVAEDNMKIDKALLERIKLLKYQEGEK